MTKDDVLKLMHREIELAGSQVAFAEDARISASYVSDVLNGRRDPGQSILDYLLLEEVKTYRRKVGK